MFSLWEMTVSRQVLVAVRIQLGEEKEEKEKEKKGKNMKTVFKLFSDGKGHLEKCFFDRDGQSFWVLENGRFRKG